jgi:hypothetical protein
MTRQRLPERRRLPNRRAALAFEFVHGGQRYRAHVGFFNDGRPAELFLNAAKQNSPIDAFAADAAILISLLLQREAAICEIGHALRRTPNGEAASLIGAAIDELSKLAPPADGEAMPVAPLIPSGLAPGAVDQAATSEPVQP